MKKYNHDFNDGDIVTDVDCNEIFYFSDSTDGYKAQENKGAFRLSLIHLTNQT